MVREDDPKIAEVTAERDALKLDFERAARHSSIWKTVGLTGLGSTLGYIAGEIFFDEDLFTYIGCAVGAVGGFGVSIGL